LAMLDQRDAPARQRAFFCYGIRRCHRAESVPSLQSSRLRGRQGWGQSGLAARRKRSWAMISGISAVTLATHDMVRAVRFYRMLGFQTIHGGEAAGFTSFRLGGNFLNLILQPAEKEWSWWGRVIFYDD